MPCNCQPTCTCSKGSCSCADCPNSSASQQEKKAACGCGETCNCAPGQCKCESCPAKGKKTENTFSSSETAPPAKDVSGAATVDGDKQTSKNCSCKNGCSCAPGKCECGDSCSGSNKKTENTFSSSETAKPASDVSGAASVDK